MTETPINESSTPIKRRVRITLIVLGASFLFLVALFWAVSIGVNSIGVSDLQVKKVELDSVGPIRAVPMSRGPYEKAPIENVRPAAKLQAPIFSEFEREFLTKQQAPAPESGPGAQYVRLVRRFRAEKPDEDFKKVFPAHVVKYPGSNGTVTTRTLAWDGEPLSEAQANWVRDHAPLIEEIRRFVESDDPAPLNREEIDGLNLFGDDENISYNTIRWNLFGTCAQLLVADGTLKAQEGKFGEALRNMTDLYRLIAKDQESAYEHSGLSSRLLAMSNRAVRGWIEASPDPTANAAAFSAYLDDFHRRKLSTPVRKSNYEFFLKYYYESMRNRAAWRFAHSERARSWKSPEYGYDLDRPGNFYEYWWVPNPRSDLQIPRVDRMLMTTIKAMNNRAAAPGIEARRLDDQEQHSRILATWNWAVLQQHIKNGDPTPWFFQMGSEFFLETEFNLNRAALAWLKDKKSAEVARTSDLTKDYENPWRDPYTEKAFLINETTTGTLIYSPGPDLVDQHGQIPFDANSVPLSPGDIAIRVTH